MLQKLRWVKLKKSGVRAENPFGRSVSEVTLIKESALFDEHWYKERFLANGPMEIDAIEHYVSTGSAQGFAPHPLFDLDWYLAEHPDAAESGLTPLGHFLRIGIERMASPHPLFDTKWYLSFKPNLVNVKGNYFRHFVSRGAMAGIWPHPLFDSDWYFDRNNGLRASGINPLTHFVERGAKEGFSPNPFFNVQWYRKKYLTGQEFEINPLAHYVRFGAALGHRPSPEVDLARYKRENLDAPRDDFGAFVRLVSQDRDRYLSVFGSSVSPTIIVNGTEPSGSAANDLAVLDVTDYGTFISNDDVEPPPAYETDPGPSLVDQMAGISLVSFDVWDTLLRRNCHPDEIKLQSARFLYIRAFQYLRPAYRNQLALYRARIYAENSRALNDDLEFRFAAAVDLWLSSTLEPGTSDRLRALFIKEVVDHERAAELRSVRLDQFGVRLLSQLDKPAIFTSDFYLPGDVLRLLLKTTGVVDSFIRGYASCDTFETKRSGQLYRRILKDFQLRPEELLQVGDNPNADIAVPSRLGIRTFHYVNDAEKRRARWYAEAFDSRLDDDLQRHQNRILRIVDDFAKKHEQSGGEHAELQAFGARIAPLVFGFCLSILQDAKINAVDRVYFFTREGIFFRKVYDSIAENDPFNLRYPASEILEVSRRATFAASLDVDDPEDLMRLWRLYSSQSFRAFTVSLNLDEEFVQGLAQEYHLNFDHVIPYPWKHPIFKKIVSDDRFQAHFKERLEEQQENVRSYLREKQFLADQGRLRLIVDVGWRGTIQDNLASILDLHLRGHFLALFKYLNPQPGNVTKIAWLADDNVETDKSMVGDVAPFEMLFSSIGGSVIGYQRTADGAKPLKVTYDGEERVLRNPIAFIQEGMLSAIPALCDYVRLHGLVAEDLRGVSRQIAVAIAARPPTFLADAFFTLEHNETFGTGKFESMGKKGDIALALDQKYGSRLHYELSSILAKTRWPEGALRQTVFAEWWKHTTPAARANVPVSFALSLAGSPAIVKAIGSRLAVFMPPPMPASGGHRTIFNMVRSLARLGFEPHILLEASGDGISVVEEYLGNVRAHIHTAWHPNIPCDVAFATIANSAETVSKLLEAHHRCYLVQDHEALFNPASDAYVIAENSYRLGLQHFTIGNWLSHIIRQQYGAAATPAGLGVDVAVYKPRKLVPRENKAVCFLYQPEKPRRTPLLGIDALRRVKQAMPDVTVYVYGSNTPLKLDFPIVNLGLIHDLEELNELYNRCAAGLCISMTNPSRIPYEMMAAGCIPVDLYRYNNLMDHESGTAILAYQSAESLASAIESVLTNPKASARRSAAAYELTRTRTLEWEMDAISHGVLRLLDGDRTCGADIKVTYTDPPVIAESDQVPWVNRFCDWQIHCATDRLNSVIGLAASSSAGRLSVR